MAASPHCTRRAFIKASTAAAALLASGWSLAFQAAAPVAFPSQKAVLTVLNDPAQLGIQGDMWIYRAMGLVEALWPAMDKIAAGDGKPVTKALYLHIKTVAGMEEFLRTYPACAEAKALRAYVENLPGYGIVDGVEDAIAQNRTITSHVDLTLRKMGFA